MVRERDRALCLHRSLEPPCFTSAVPCFAGCIHGCFHALQGYARE